MDSSQDRVASTEAGADLDKESHDGRTLLLVDGMAVAYRAFHAIRELSADDGRATNAVFGFVKMAQRLAADWNPSHWGVVFEGGLPVERLALIPQYKAQRPPMPDSLREQMKACRRYLDAARIHTMTIQGEEADDVLAALARHGESAMDSVLIATGDKDLYQVVGPRIRVVPVAGGGRVAWGREEVVSKTGVEPGQVAAWLALVGDSADNIPGVPGIGPKTAARLLAQFGDLERLFQRLEEWPSDATRATLVAYRDRVFQNCQAIRLREESVPSVGDWDVWRRRDPDEDALLAFYKDMGFRSLAAKARQQELF